MAGTRCAEPLRLREGRSLEEEVDSGPAVVARREEPGRAVPVVLPHDPVAAAALALETNFLGLATYREEEVDVIHDPPRRHDGPRDLRDWDVLHRKPARNSRQGPYP